MCTSERILQNRRFVCDAYRAGVRISRLVVPASAVAPSLLALLVAVAAAIRIAAVLPVALRHAESMHK
jgi:hypothetical protein